MSYASKSFLSLCAALALLTAPAAEAADNRAAKPEMRVKLPEWGLNTEIWDFPSGLRIMFQHDDSHDTVGVYSVVNRGSADDPQDLAEVAHFVEHTWFRSVHGDLPPVMDVIQDIGAVFNATTHNDFTDYQTFAGKDFLPLLLRLESLRITEPYIGVTEDQITVEREVIRNEWRRRNEQSSALFANYMNEAIYPEGHGYHVSSTHTTIDNIKLKDLQKFFDDYYQPNEITIFVVGDIPTSPLEQMSLILENFDLAVLDENLTPDDLYIIPRPGIEDPDPTNPKHVLTGAFDPADRAKEPAERNFYPRLDPSKRTPRISEDRPPVPELGSAEVLTRQWPQDEKMVLVGWSLPGGYRDDHWNLQLLGNLAGSYVQQGFYEDIDRGRIEEASCGSWAEVTNTTFFCYAVLKDEKMDAERVRDRILDQLPELWNPENAQSNMLGGFAFWLPRTRNQLLAQMLDQVDTYIGLSSGRASDTAIHTHYTATPDYYSSGMEQAFAIDAGTISALAKKYLRRDRAATVVLEPLSDDEIDTTSEFSSYAGANATDVVINASDDLENVTKADLEAAYVKPDLEGMLDFKLDNGLRVIVKQHGESPLVQTSLFVNRNYWEEDPYTYSFVAANTRSVGVDPLQIATTVNYFVNPGTPGLYPGFGRPLYTGGLGVDALVLTVRTPSGNLDSGLWMLREEVETASPYISGKARFYDNAEKDLKGNWFDPEWHLSRVRNEFLYPNHSAGRTTTWDDIQAIKGWGNAKVNTYLEQHLRPDNATLFVAGDLDYGKAKELVEQYWGGWKSKSGAEPVPAMKKPEMPTQAPRVIILDEPTRTQSQMYASCRLNVDGPEEKPAVSVLGSLMRNRTVQTLRIQEGLAYSPGAYTDVGAHGGGELTFYSLATNAGVGRTLEFFKQMVDEVGNGDVDDTEVTLHKLRRARSTGVFRQSIAQFTGALVNVVNEDADWSLITDAGKTISEVDKDQLTKLLEGCSDHMVATIQGPKDVITPQLDERGIDYEVLEWQSFAEELLWTHDPKAAKKREKDKQKRAKKADKKKDKADKKGDDDEGTDQDGEASAE